MKEKRLVIDNRKLNKQAKKLFKLIDKLMEAKVKVSKIKAKS